MKKYIIYTIKRHIPLFAVTFAICFSIFMSYFSSISIERITYNDNYIYDYLSDLFNLDSGIILVAVPLAILTMILPVFANSYRYRLRAVDVFYQVGKGKKSIRYVNNLSLLIAVLASFTIAFLFGVIILGLRQIPNINREPTVTTISTYGPYGTTITDTKTTYYIVYNFAYYIPVYLLLILGGLINYFISYFLVTRSNNLVNSIIILLLGHLVLGIGIMTPIWYAQIILNYIGSVDENYITLTSNFLGGTQTASIVSPIAWTYYLFNGRITGYSDALDSTWFMNMDAADNLSFALSIVCTLVFIAAGILGFLYFLKEDESSGEYAGKAPGRDKIQIIIFHIGFGLIGLWTGVTNSIGGVIQTLIGVVAVISQTIIFGAIYFVFIGLLRRNFKINKKELLIMIFSCATNFMLGIILTVIIPQIGL